MKTLLSLILALGLFNSAHAQTLPPRALSGQLEVASPAAKTIAAKSLYDMMKKPLFAKRFREAFYGYTALRWINNPQLGSLARIEQDPELGELLIYTFCRPHACGAEYARFIITTDFESAWGYVNIRSGTVGGADFKSISKIFEGLEVNERP